MEQKNESVLVTKQSFLAVGLKWEGTFAEAGAGGIRIVQTELQNRLDEIKHVIDSATLLGLSYHTTESGFTHYAVVMVDRFEDLPDGMVAITVPTLSYAKCEHKKEQNIETSYNNIYAWIEQEGYKLHNGDLTHFEKYPMKQDPFSSQPEFIIMIPIDK